jgi:uncharacterized protein YkwD
MKVSSARGAARTPKRSAKIIPFPSKKGLRHRRAVRVASIGIAIGVCGALATRVNTFHGYGGAPTQDEGLRSAVTAQELQILKLVNDERIRAGAQPLQFSPRLLAATRRHSVDMAMRDYLGHDGPNGDTPADRARMVGLGYQELAENLYSDTVADIAELPARVVKGWLQSPAHRDNLLSQRFEASAVGIGKNSAGKFYITEDFIR